MMNKKIRGRFFGWNYASNSIDFIFRCCHLDHSSKYGTWLLGGIWIMRRWYEELFTNYAKTYDTESFTTGTLLGFRKSSIHGSHLGNLSREHVLTTDDFEMLVIAEK